MEQHEIPVELHLIPGLFSDVGQRAIAAVTEGAPALSATNLLATDGDGAPVEDVQSWLLGTSTRSARRAEGRLRVPGGRTHPLVLEVCEGHPAGRLLVALHVRFQPKEGHTHKDLELGLLGLACQVLSAEGHGAALLGSGIGPAGSGLTKGSFREQLRGLLDVHDGSIELLLTTPDSAAYVPADLAQHEEQMGSLHAFRLGDHIQ